MDTSVSKNLVPNYNMITLYLKTKQYDVSLKHLYANNQQSKTGFRNEKNYFVTILDNNNNKLCEGIPLRILQIAKTQM